jgi:hypothetical protein
MLTKRTIVDQIEITRTGHIGIRFRKEVVEDGRALSSDFHRTGIEIGGDIDAQMSAVNADLQSKGWPAVDPAEYAEVKEYAKIKWTPAKVAEWLQSKQAAIEEMK